MKRWLYLSQLARTKQVHQSRAGYTITEVLIVLAVTTVMFFVLILSFNGRQGRVEFTQAVRNYEAEILNVISETAEGSYESRFDCRVNGAGGIDINDPPRIAANLDDCIFLGKIFGSDTDESKIYTIVGKRLHNGSDVANLAEAQPVAVNSNPGPNITEVFTHSYGLQVTKVLRLNGPPHPVSDNVAGFGFINQLSGGVEAVGSSTSKSVYLYGIPTTFSGNINSVPARVNQLIPLSEGILICLEGGNGQFAEITVGANNSQTSISSVLDTTSTGYCA